MLDVVAKTVRNEGILAMYQGLESTMWRHILWNAGYFGCIFQVRQLLPKADTKQSQMLNDILAGSVGGTVGTLLNTPMDVVKSRIQNETRVPGMVSKYNWAWPAVGTVLKEEGFAALYKGFLPKVLRLGPGGTFFFFFLASLAFVFSGRFVLTISCRWYPPGRLPGHNGLLPQDEREQGIDVDGTRFLVSCFLRLFLFGLGSLAFGFLDEALCAHKNESTPPFAGLAFFCSSFIYFFGHTGMHLDFFLHCLPTVSSIRLNIFS